MDNNSKASPQEPNTSGNPVGQPNSAARNDGTKQVLIVHMSSPEKVFFEGQAEAVTSINDKGEFDLLPLHENFICIIKKKAVIHYKIGNDKKEYELDSGVIKIQKNRVYILTGFEVLGDKELSEETPVSSAQPVSGGTLSPAAGAPATKF